jgi:hypothetical protein
MAKRILTIGQTFNREAFERNGKYKIPTYYAFEERKPCQPPMRGGGDFSEAKPKGQAKEKYNRSGVDKEPKVK